MGVPTVVSTSPTSAAVSVYKNKVITATFSEALLASSVNTGTFLLENTETLEIVPVVLTLSSTIVSITPVRNLADSTTYKLTIVGSDTALSSGAVKSSSSSDSLVSTAYVVFTTGTEIEVVGLTKTTTDLAQEGDIDLPSNIQVLADPGYLSILSTTPVNRTFYVERDLSSIQVEFSEAIDTSVFSDSYFTVTQTAYYEEDEDMLAFPDTSDGDCNFKWQNPRDTSQALLDFSDLSGTISISNQFITWTPDEDRDFPANAKVSVVLSQEIQGVSGITLDGDYKMVFYTEPCPYVVSVDRVRDSFYPHVLTNWTDDMIGKTIYKNSSNALNFTRWQYDIRVFNKYFREYVLAATEIDILVALRIEDELQAGQFKRLGDLAVRFDSNMAQPSSKQKEAMKRAEAAKEVLTRRFVDTMRFFVKGKYNPEQRAVWRTRLWKQDICYALEGMYVGPKNAGNTGDDRAARVPGWGQNW